MQHSIQKRIFDTGEVLAGQRGRHRSAVEGEPVDANATSW